MSGQRTRSPLGLVEEQNARQPELRTQVGNVGSSSSVYGGGGDSSEGAAGEGFKPRAYMLILLPWPLR